MGLLLPPPGRLKEGFAAVFALVNLIASLIPAILRHPANRTAFIETLATVSHSP